MYHTERRCASGKLVVVQKGTSTWSVGASLFTLRQLHQIFREGDIENRRRCYERCRFVHSGDKLTQSGNKKRPPTISVGGLFSLVDVASIPSGAYRFYQLFSFQFLQSDFNRGTADAGTSFEDILLGESDENFLYDGFYHFICW